MMIMLDIGVDGDGDDNDDAGDDDGVDDDGDVDRDEEQRGSLFGLPASLNIHHYCHPNQMHWGSCIMKFCMKTKVSI